MGCGVDAARQPRDHDETRLAQIARQPGREFLPGGRRVTRADERNARPQQGIGSPNHRQQGGAESIACRGFG